MSSGQIQLFTSEKIGLLDVNRQEPTFEQKVNKCMYFKEYLISYK